MSTSEPTEVPPSEARVPEIRPTEIQPWLSISTPGRYWLYLAGSLGAMVLGAVFLVAAWAKALDPAAFAAQIEREGLDFLLSSRVVAAIAIALEVFLGAALVLGVRRRFILWPTAALVVFFLFLTGRTYYQDLQGTLVDDGAGCGCFGKLVDRTPAEAFWQDALLMVPALLLAFVARRTDPVWPGSRERPNRRMGIVGVVTAAALLLAWKAPDLPLDDLATRLKPGIDPLALCAGAADNGSRACMSDIVPELAEGDHLVVLAELTDAFGADVGQLNEYHWSVSDAPAAGKPRLWVVTSSGDDDKFTFQFTHGPAFEIRDAPQPLLAPLYRTLPRSFFVREGKVAETWRGLPPLERWDQAP